MTGAEDEIVRAGPHDVVVLPRPAVHFEARKEGEEPGLSGPEELLAESGRLGDAGPEDGVVRVLDDQEDGRVVAGTGSVERLQSEAVGSSGEEEAPGVALHSGRQVAVQQLPLVVREQLGALRHLGQEQVGVETVESHRLVDHVPAGRVDTAHTLLLPTLEVDTR